MLGADELAGALAFLGWEDVLRARVCKSWKEAAAAALSGDKGIFVNLEGDDKYQAVDMLGHSFLDLTHLRIRLDRSGPGGQSRIRFQDGDDPVAQNEDDVSIYSEDSEDSAARPCLSVISIFQNLKHLSVLGARLNGHYPCLVGFPWLRHLALRTEGHLKLDLSELHRCPLLETLSLCLSGQQMVGNLKSLSYLDKLKEVCLYKEGAINGSYMDLSKLPYLEKLHLSEIPVEGDLSEIRENDFPMLKEFWPPNFKMTQISEAKTRVKELYNLKKKRRELNVYCKLSQKSPENYYGIHPVSCPLSFKLVEAGARVGWRWFGNPWYGQPEGFAYCEINWIDPEPVPGSEEFSEYEKQLATLPQCVVFKGLHEPPNPEIEFRRVVGKYKRAKRS